MTGILFYSVIGITEKIQLGNEMEAVSELSQYSIRASALVHELQKERGMSAGFLGSGGVKFANELPRQRQATDSKLNDLQTYLSNFDETEFGGDFVASVKQGTSLLAQIDSYRQKVSAQTITAKEQIAYYTNLNGALLSSICETSKLSKNADVTREALTYAYFLLSKERAGIERAVLANTFAADKFGEGMYKKLVQLITEQETYLHSFSQLASDDQLKLYTATMSAPCVDEVERMRGVAFANAQTGQFGIEPTQWFGTITKKINLLKKYEDSLSEDLIAHANTLQAQASSSLTKSIVTTLILILLVSILAFYTIKGITEPIKKIVTLTHEMRSAFKSYQVVLDAVANKDLTQQVDIKDTTRLKLSGTDEVAQLAQAVDETMDAGDGIGRSINSMSEHLRVMVTQLQDNARELSSASTEIAASAEEASRGARSQSDQVSQVASATEEMSAAVIEASRNSNDASEASQKASETAAMGGQIVSETIEGMQMIADIVSESTESIRKLATSADQIGEIIQVIDDIADQTNLLALNAAIEAARAGEQGRGFAVVADEVRKLAEKTVKATEEITKMIKGIQQDTATAAESMETGMQQVEQGKKLADQAGASLNDIVAMSNQVGGMIRQIAEASKEQSSAAEQISGSLENVSTITLETAKGAEESATAAEELTRQAESVKEMVAEFKL